jgi:hypothetical protein
VVVGGEPQKDACKGFESCPYVMAFFPGNLIAERPSSQPPLPTAICNHTHFNSTQIRPATNVANI